MTREASNPDVIVVGAGLSGLTAAIALQKSGLDVLVLERHGRAGGLCGTHTLDGYEFTIACNDFGSAFADTMQDLGVQVAFTHPKSIFHTHRERYFLPPTPLTGLPFVRHAGDLRRIRIALRDLEPADTSTTVQHLLDTRVRSKDFSDFVSVTCWAFGTPPHRFRLDQFKALFSKELGYGYDHPVVPVGGPQVLVDRMASRLTELGGALKLNTTVDSVEGVRGVKTVKAGGDIFQARYVVSSIGRLNDYPADAMPSLQIGVLHIATRPDAPFPRDVHTVLYMPPGAPHWLSRLDAGEYVEATGFNVFPCEFDDEREYRSFNAYVMCPRGIDDIGDARSDLISRFILKRTDIMVPTFSNSIVYQRFLSPAEFRHIHGLGSNVIPAILPEGFHKPDGYNPNDDIYYVGNTVQPACEHAGSAIRSALRVAEAIGAG